MSGAALGAAAGQISAGVGRRPRDDEGVRLTARGRRVVFGAAVLLVGLLGLAGGRAMAASGDPAVPTVSVVVEPGDTLWGYATEVARPGEDIRDVVDAIERLNGLASAAIAAGDVILLPAR
jgi:hypothetical protein